MRSQLSLGVALLVMLGVGGPMWCAPPEAAGELLRYSTGELGHSDYDELVLYEDGRARVCRDRVDWFRCYVISLSEKELAAVRDAVAAADVARLPRTVVDPKNTPSLTTPAAMWIWSARSGPIRSRRRMANNVDVSLGPYEPVSERQVKAFARFRRVQVLLDDIIDRAASEQEACGVLPHANIVLVIVPEKIKLAFGDKLQFDALFVNAYGRDVMIPAPDGWQGWLTLQATSGTSTMEKTSRTTSYPWPPLLEVAPSASESDLAAGSYMLGAGQVLRFRCRIQSPMVGEWRLSLVFTAPPRTPFSWLSAVPVIVGTVKSLNEPTIGVE